MSKAIDEIVMRSEIRNIPRTDDVLEKRIRLNFEAPIFDGSFAKMHHQNKGPDDNSRIISRTADRRIERKEQIMSKVDVELFMLMNSRRKTFVGQTFQIRNGKRRFLTH